MKRSLFKRKVCRSRGYNKTYKMASQYQRKVLIAMDDSSYSEKAFDYYIQKIRLPNDNVILCTVAEFHPPADMFSHMSTLSTEAVTQLVKEYTDRTKDLEKKLQTKLQASGCKGEVKLVSGKPGEEIVKAAKSENADVIVIGSRGASQIRRTVFGGICSYVLHHSEISVLVVKCS